MTQQGITAGPPDHSLCEMNVAAEGDCRSTVVFRHAIATVDGYAAEIRIQSIPELSCFATLKRFLPSLAFIIYIGFRTLPPLGLRYDFLDIAVAELPLQLQEVVVAMTGLDGLRSA